MSEDAELLIAGGGLNGLVLGIACAGAGLPCAIVDRLSPVAMSRADFDGRSSAIAYGSQQVLDVAVEDVQAVDLDAAMEDGWAHGSSPWLCCRRMCGEDVAAGMSMRSGRINPNTTMRLSRIAWPSDAIRSPRLDCDGEQMGTGRA